MYRLEKLTEERHITLSRAMLDYLWPVAILELYHSITTSLCCYMRRTYEILGEAGLDMQRIGSVWIRLKGKTALCLGAENLGFCVTVSGAMALSTNGMPFQR